MRQTALWIQTGSAPGPGGAEIREFCPSDPAHVPRQRSGKPGRGNRRAGDCAESREQPQATGAAPEGKGKGKKN